MATLTIEYATLSPHTGSPPTCNSHVCKRQLRLGEVIISGGNQFFHPSCSTYPMNKAIAANDFVNGGVTREEIEEIARGANEALVQVFTKPAVAKVAVKKKAAPAKKKIAKKSASKKPAAKTATKAKPVAKKAPAPTEGVYVNLRPSTAGASAPPAVPSTARCSRGSHAGRRNQRSR